MSEEQQENPRPRPKYGGGPHGVGFPDDRSLRKVERDVAIPKIIRDRSRTEKCVPEVAEFTKCCKDAGYAMVYKCRPQNAELIKCLTKWFYDEDFIKECTEQYLNDRSEYRRTGIGKKQREAMAKEASTNVQNA